MMCFEKSYVLENERVLLLPLRLEDIDYLIYFVQNEPEIWEFTLDQPTTRIKFEKYIQNALEERSKEKSYTFIVFDKQANKYAGCTRVYDINQLHRNCSIGYTWYGKEFQGTGLNNNCKFLLLEFAFEEMGMERIQFRADVDNKKSIQAIKSIGCTQEGVLRSNMFRPDGTRRSSAVLSMLKEEWMDCCRERLKHKIGYMDKAYSF